MTKIKLAYCPECNQMVNHQYNQCPKCFLRNEGKEEAYKNVASWFKLPLKNSKGLSGGYQCDVCGGRTVSIRGKYPKEENREVCPTCSFEILEDILNNCLNRGAVQTKN